MRYQYRFIFMFSTTQDIGNEILQKIALGDERAFSNLYNHYWKRLYNYLIRVTQSHEMTEEIVVDVFLKLWSGKEMLPTIKSMDSFLFRVAHNKAMDFLNLAARNERIQKIIAKSIQQNIAPAADHSLMDQESQQILQKAIEKLSSRRRMVFTLSRMDGLSNDEIAKQLNLSRQTVKNTLVDAVCLVKNFVLQKNTASTVLVLLLINA